MVKRWAFPALFADAYSVLLGPGSRPLVRRSATHWRADNSHSDSSHPNIGTKLRHRYHSAQYRADISLAVLLLDLHPGKRVVECGTGSGTLSYTLATTVAPTGHVFTYDFHNQRKQFAEQFFRDCKLSDYISSYDRDAYSPDAFLVEGEVWESSVDSVFFDLPSPWDALGNAKVVLKNFGKLVSFTPTVEQSRRISQALSDSGFIEIKTFEILCKPWGIGFDDSNAENAQFACYQLSQPNHTGYLTAATLVKS
ncbi:tRNA (adenine(58)-N(1))-methyltransferase catalytic subunit TRMT61A [Babesia caballi]|uniref:tRNA (adenine(58)-N(1))-methyltransferase n=1 Tax=Babesia caballi TaxID=5871 RepID=A0AAV4LTK8_BABCB|nr:tRNA (adenine(58)-N(1))-methyltransferase catalytic subunit TRMT61A [Babesia caballi]